MAPKTNTPYSTDVKPDTYLKVNSCGCQIPRKTSTVLREQGRSDYHILLVIEGTMKAEYAGRRVELKSGNLLLYEPGQRQWYVSQSGTAYFWLHFNGLSLQEIIRDFDLKGGVYAIGYHRGVFENFSRLIRQFSQPECQRLVNGTLLTLLASVSLAVGSAPQAETSQGISEVLNYIHMNYNKKLTVRELADRSGYSRSRFMQRFASETHTTPLQYQKNIRLNSACELLGSTDDSIGAIALSCGYEDPLYFCRVFKSRYGVSPSRYRNRTRR